MRSGRTAAVWAALGALGLAACTGGKAPSTDGSPATSPSPTAGTSPTPSPPATGPAGPGEPGGYRPAIDPAQFSTMIDNPYYPLVPGTRRTYEARTDEGVERSVVEVTRDTKTVMGVPCAVVHDAETLNGRLIEDTYDWFAQDRGGTVWYFGEDTRTYRNGKVTGTAGSWEAGVAGAQPGIVMEAHPKVGDTYRQEYRKDVAEDEGQVVSLSESVAVAAGSFSEVVSTKDFTRLEPRNVERKFYAKGVGLVLELESGNERVELVKIEPVP